MRPNPPVGSRKPPPKAALNNQDGIMSLSSSSWSSAFQVDVLWGKCSLLGEHHLQSGDMGWCPVEVVDFGPGSKDTPLLRCSRAFLNCNQIHLHV
jgi:hypothetical protein